MTTVPPLGSLPAAEGPDLVREDLFEAIFLKYRGAARSVQVTMGPSEAGNPCDRNLVYKLSGHPEAPNRYEDPWPSILGTAGHDWLDAALLEHNQALIETGRDPIWQTSEKVYFGSPAVPYGHTDAFHVPARRVVDFKILGNTSYDGKRSHREATDEYWTTRGSQYYDQIQLYGYGKERAGAEVREVALAVFGRSKRLWDMLMIVFPYDRDRAQWVLRRAEAAQVLALGGVEPLSVPAQPSSSACAFCEFKGNEDEGFCAEKARKKAE